MGRISCKPAARLSRGMPRLPALPVETVETRAVETPAVTRALQELRHHEPVTPIHSSSGRNHASDGGRVAGGLGGVHAVAGVGATRSRLSHHPGGDVLSGSRSRCDGVVGDFAVGAAVWPGSGPEPDDLDEFVWQFGDYAASRARPEHRRGRAAGASGDQRRADVPTYRSSESSNL